MLYILIELTFSFLQFEAGLKKKKKIFSSISVSHSYVMGLADVCLCWSDLSSFFSSLLISYFWLAFGKWWKCCTLAIKWYGVVSVAKSVDATRVCSDSGFMILCQSLAVGVNPSHFYFCPLLNVWNLETYYNYCI